MTNPKVLRIRNYVLIGLSVAYYILYRIFGLPLPSVYNSPDIPYELSRNVSDYMKENLAFAMFFLLFITVSSTSFLLAYIIYNKFDRNRDAAKAAVHTGLLFLCIAVMIITGTGALDVFSEHVELFDYLHALSVLFLPLIFSAYFRVFYKKKWVYVFEWTVTALALLCFIFSVLSVPQFIIQIIFISVHSSTIGLMLVCSFVYTSYLIRRKIAANPVNTVLSISNSLLCAAAAVFHIMGMMTLYWLCLGSATAILAFMTFSELVDMAARQYIKSVDAENYRKMAYIDALCGISNRNAFLLEQSETYNSDSLYYVVFDVNNLKRINDSYGHSEGDEIIRKSAELICISFEKIGKCFRIGGDEFVVIGQYSTDEEIRRCLRNLSELIEIFNSDSEAKLSLAYGYAIRTTLEITTYELFNRADRDMYRFKKRLKAYKTT